MAHQAPVPMEFSRQEYWSELPFPDPGTVPISLKSPAFQADSLPPAPPTWSGHKSQVNPDRYAKGEYSGLSP